MNIEENIKFINILIGVMEQTLNMEKYRLIDHTSDIGIEVFGENLPQLFSNAGYALFDIITDLSLVKSKVSKSVTVTGRDLDEIMVNWLGELLYIYDKERIILKEFKIIELNTSSITSKDKKQDFCQIIASKNNTEKDKEVAFSFKEKKSPEEVEWLKLVAEIRGERYDDGVHIINTTVKAITYHQLKIIKDDIGWHTRVIMDV
ncbi:MAG: hypothetical protein A3C43_05835 [Candidatus Schekmanbacteria bacterium RIFCSPHIGHO2_02_FULL_38_11]|uniref:Archease domain-containing protein n=1 Tax=Candidatus Schekmanbacteria bacterium RIFCSPLOWO2_12_FULL_38_15 TaxID=1817883 RepID=A0A1F7SL28_9BACT|nr:MAG: hypothetical protein A2043_05800 [Candidatus Schekmanbacteria bacterium GWA2_38_9]OGL48023.1 MAG: hypothetical protein A3H37_08340 [Candidatus Schekmanbacteria bacterium RIFCSPLOWO2_02_FULL_38_14]OGL54492.1 MAG: hypothetical protein A3G31_10050 [Candidatus Schekmanbacteria bacterium RIFCSPLOWO2_12_FULL_38_15]OGL55692.1 MAG: hypothetical protein A3C43_05835 [Candidatus Schekmanbacteria bacterium RIFCSPHIGHO2_02_FULL_38_11]